MLFNPICRSRESKITDGQTWRATKSHLSSEAKLTRRLLPNHFLPTSENSSKPIRAQSRPTQTQTDLLLPSKFAICQPEGPTQATSKERIFVSFLSITSFMSLRCRLLLFPSLAIDREASHLLVHCFCLMFLVFLFLLSFIILLFFILSRFRSLFSHYFFIYSLILLFFILSLFRLIFSLIRYLFPYTFILSLFHSLFFYHFFIYSLVLYSFFYYVFIFSPFIHICLLFFIISHFHSVFFYSLILYSFILLTFS